MSQSSDQIEEQDREWDRKGRFKGISQQELDRIAAQDKEIADSQEEVNRIIEDGLKDPERNFETKETEAAREKKKQELKKKIYSD